MVCAPSSEGGTASGGEKGGFLASGVRADSQSAKEAKLLFLPLLSEFFSAVYNMALAQTEEQLSCLSVEGSFAPQQQHFF